MTLSHRTLAVSLAVSGLTLGLSTVSDAATVTRGPYLQMGTSDGIVVRWRTDVLTDSRVMYGTAPNALIWFVNNPALTTEHEVRLPGLAADTRYYYAIGSSTQTLAGGDASHFFVTAPPPGTPRPTRVWVLGDSGTADANARAVRDAYYGFAGTRHTDLWLMLGDNAYRDGTDPQYQAAVFNMYPEMLRTSVLWPTLGNHDGNSANSSTQTGPYYDIFTLPARAEAGGIASGTEAYYSFDHGNIHFIVLDSFGSDRSPGGAMLTWLAQDLMATRQDWVIAYWHHPPYSKGSHNSDTELGLREMRQYAVPILEDHGVDLVLAGHSHSYERSFLIDGHYGTSDTLGPGMILDGGDGRPTGTGAYEKPFLGPDPHRGAVYTVAGSSGKASGGTLNHPVMFVSLNVLGSVVLDVLGNQLDATFLDSTGAARDTFTMLKGSSGNVPPGAENDLAVTDEDTVVAVPVLSNDTDADGDPLSVVGVSQPANGMASIEADGSLTYSPRPDLHGVDSFAYTVSDGRGGQSTATVTVTVNPVNDPPAAFDIQDRTTTPGTSVTVAFTVTDPDTPSAALALWASSSNQALLPDQNIGFGGSADARTITLTPVSGQTGSASITVTVSDGTLTAVDTSVLDVRAAGRTAINVPGDFPSIQAAHDAASSGDTILVAPGTYVGPITITKAVTLASRHLITGDESYIGSTILDGGNGRSVIEIPANAEDRPTIHGFTIQNAEDGIFPHAKFNLLHCVVRNTADGVDYEGGSGGLVEFCTFELNSDDGLDLDFDVDVVIRNNVIRNNADDGIEIRLQSFTGPTLNVVVEGNRIYGNGEDGIQLIHYDVVTNRVFEIRNNFIHDNADAGIGMMNNEISNEDFRAADIPERINIIGNTFVNNSHGITGGDNTVVVNNLFVNHSVIAVKNVDANSELAFNLFFNNGTDNSGSNVDSGRSLFADPHLTASLELLPGSPAIDAGTAFYAFRGATVLDLSPSAYSGTAPDIGAAEFDSGPGVPPAPPSLAPPTNVTAGAISSTEIRATWEPSSGASGYRVERSTDAGASWEVAGSTSEATSFSDTGLDPGTTYHYRIVATSLGGDSEPSATASATTLADIVFTNLGSSAPDLNDNTDRTSYTTGPWTPPTSGAIILFVQSNRSGGPDTPVVSGNGLAWVQVGTTLKTTGGNGLSVFVAHAAGGTTGETRISFGSNTQTHAVALFAYATGVDLSGGAAAVVVQRPTSTGSGTSGSLAFAAGGNPANRQIVAYHHLASEVTTPDVAWLEFDDVSGSGRTRGVETQVKPDSFSFFSSASWATSSNWGAVGLELRAASAGPTGPPPAPAPTPDPPTNVTAIPVSPTEIEVSWNASIGATGYQLERSTDNGTSWTTAGAGIGALSFTDRNLLPATTYHYRVIALNGPAESVPSLVAQATTPAAAPVPAAPSNLTAAANAGSKITLAWRDNADNETGLEIERARGSQAFALIATVGPNATGYVDTGLRAGATYKYRVRAYNTSGQSAFSNTAKATAKR